MPSRRTFLEALATSCSISSADARYGPKDRPANLSDALDSRARDPGVTVAAGFVEADSSDAIVRGASLPGATFEIGSITKTFTGTLLGLMVLAREAALDDPLEKFMPPGAVIPSWNGKRITLLDLATHSSRLPRLPVLLPANVDDPYGNYSLADALRFLTAFPSGAIPSDSTGGI